MGVSEALIRLRSRELKYVPTSGNPKQLLCFLPTRCDENSFQQCLRCKQRAHIVHAHIMRHKLMVLTLLFALEHLRNGDVVQFYQGDGFGDVASKPARDTVFREQASKPFQRTVETIPSTIV